MGVAKSRVYRVPVLRTEVAPLPGGLYADSQALLPQALLVKLGQLLVARLGDRPALRVGSHMTFVARLTVIPAMTLTRTQITRGIEFSQSLCRITSQGAARSGP